MIPIVNPAAPNDQTHRQDVARAVNQLIGKKLLIKSVTAAYTLENDYDVIKADTTSAAFTITLPKASLHSGRIAHFKRINAGANNLTLDGDGTETIDGAATITLTAQWESKSLLSDGSNWLVL